MGLVRPPPTAGFCPSPQGGVPTSRRQLRSLGFLVKTAIPGPRGPLVRGSRMPAQAAVSPGSPTLCPGESRLSGRVTTSLHPGSGQTHAPFACRAAGLPAGLSTRTVWARCPSEGTSPAVTASPTRTLLGTTGRRSLERDVCHRQVLAGARVRVVQGGCSTRRLQLSQTRPIPAARLADARHRTLPGSSPRKRTGAGPPAELGPATSARLRGARGHP